MDPITPPAAPPAPPLPPPPPPPPMPPVAPPAAPPTEAYAQGGVLKSFDWVEIGFMVLGAFALYHIIDYYRKKAKAELQTQATISELMNKTERQEAALSAIGKQVKQRKQF